MFVAKRNVKRAKSLTDLGKTVRMEPRLGLVEALQRHWDFDAHVFPYFVKSSKDQAVPAAKAFLPHVRKAGDDLLIQDFFVDFDLEKGRAWAGREEVEEAFRAMAEALEESGLPEPTWAYSTKHGLRAVWSLQEPVPVDVGEKYLRALHVALGPVSARLPGLRLDPACTDWTRCYRLPFVTRESGEETWEQDWSMLLGPGERLALKKCEELCEIAHPSPAAAEPVEVEEIDDPLPTRAEVERSLWDAEGKQTPVVRRLFNQFRGSEVFPILLYGHVHRRPVEPLPEKGTRYPLMKRRAGALVAYALAWEPDTVTLQILYAMVYHWVEAIAKQGDWEKDPHRLMWDLLKYAWAREQARLAQKKQEALQQVQEKEDFLTELVHKVERWNDLPEFTEGTLGDKKEWILSHLFLYHSKTGLASVLLPNGEYDFPAHKISKINLLHILHSCGIESLVELSKQVEDKVIQKPLPEILRDQAAPLQAFEIDAAISGCHLRKEDSAYILERGHVLEPPLEPRFDPTIDEWLKLFVPTEYWKPFCQWLAGAKNLDKPIPALALVGAASAGKSMLATAIQQFLRYRIAADESVLKSWTGQLKETACVILEEGLSKSFSKTGEYAKRFKGLLSGTQVTGNEKYGMQFPLKIKARFIICANDPQEVLEGLFESSKLKVFNRDAINERFLIILVTSAAREYLEKHGHYQLTEDWITGKKLASHLEFLAQNTEVSFNKRFQVEIPNQLKALQEEFLEEEVGDRIEFVGIILEALQFWRKANDQRHLKVLKNTFALTTKKLFDYISKTSYARHWPSLKSVASSLKDVATMKRTYLDGEFGRWYILDRDVMKRFESYTDHNFEAILRSYKNET